MTAEALERDLKRLLGERATTSTFEGWFYRSDIQPIPSLVRRLMQTRPEAVVYPVATEEVAAVVRFCAERGLPVVPRGGGSSGLFGAVPKRGGVVFDLRGLNSIGPADASACTVTVAAGATWWRLEEALAGQGLATLSYPSSARSATVAGWVMTSGLGIGSLKYGPVFGHVLAAELVLPDGTVSHYRAGEGLEQFFESEGTLGIVTRLTLKVRPRPARVGHRLVRFDDMGRLFEAVSVLAAASPCPYNIEFQDAGYLQLLRQAGYETVELPGEGGLVLVTADGDDDEVAALMARVAQVSRDLGGVECEGAEREWAHRFDMLRVKRAAPAIVPSSVYLPLSRLGEFYARYPRVVRHRGGLLGYAVGPDRASLMPMLPADDRSPLRYIFALQTPSAVSRLAISLGGKPGGGIGVWNAAFRREVLGRERLAAYEEKKRTLDPAGIMNPGVGAGAPWLFQPRLYRAATRLGNALGRLLPAGVPAPEADGFRAELAACAQCGYCMDVCPTAGSWLSSTPRGRVLMGRQRPEALPPEVRREYLERLYQCTLCGRCGVDCTVGISSRPMWQGLRGYLNGRGLRLERLDELTSTIMTSRNMAGRPNEQRAAWVGRVRLGQDPRQVRRAELVYFVGCVTSFFPMAQPAARAFSQILAAAGLEFAVMGGDEWCCGFPLLAAGEVEAAAACIRHNIEQVAALGAKTVVLTCPGCYRVWKDEYREVIGQAHPFEVLHATELLARWLEEGRIKPGALPLRVTYHDPCDLGRNSGILDEPRYVLGSIPGLELVELAESGRYASCCGSGGDLLASNQELALEIARRKVDEVVATGAETVVTACPSCVRAISMARTAGRVKLAVQDISEIVWKAVSGG